MSFEPGELRRISQEISKCSTEELIELRDELGPGSLAHMMLDSRIKFRQSQQTLSSTNFYKAVKDLTDKAFRMEKLGIDFVNAEDLERLLTMYNPNPTEEDEDSYDSESTPDKADGEVPSFELPDDKAPAERPWYRS